MSYKPGASGGVVPLSVPEIRGNAWKYVKECLDTNWVSSAGSFVDRFERIVADYVGAKYAVATINGTAALHISLLVAGVEPEDEVLVSSMSFIAPANVIRYAGAWPVFMDSDPTYWQMDPAKVTSFLEEECQWKDDRLVNRSTGRRVKAILPVHILGHPCDMGPILETARRYRLTVIEDATESLGAKYDEHMVGRLGDLGCFSFNGNKLITTGGGGMIVTDRQDLAERARYLTTQARDDSVEYIHNEIGYNYRLTNIQAALGVAQMEQIEEFLTKKRAIAQAYNEGVRDIHGITPMPCQSGAEPAYWLYTALLSKGTTIEERKAVIEDLNRRGIGARPLFHPLHSLPPYSQCQAFQIETADELYRRGVSLPSSVGLTEMEQMRCIDSLKEVLKNNDSAGTPS